MRKLNTVLSKRVIKFLQQQAKDDEDAYLDFFREFGQYIKEGVYSDFASKEEAAKLLRFESSTAKEGELISLDDYISRMVPAQDDQIYFLLASSRETALSSAYIESLKAKDVEVLLLYSTVDEFVMTNLMSYSGKSLLSAENAKLSLDTPAEEAASPRRTRPPSRSGSRRRSTASRRCGSRRGSSTRRRSSSTTSRRRCAR